MKVLCKRWLLAVVFMTYGLPWGWALRRTDFRHCHHTWWSSHYLPDLPSLPAWSLLPSSPWSLSAVATVCTTFLPCSHSASVLSFSSLALSQYVIPGQKALFSLGEHQLWYTSLAPLKLSSFKSLEVLFSPTLFLSAALAYPRHMSYWNFETGSCLLHQGLSVRLNC